MFAQHVTIDTLGLPAYTCPSHVSEETTMRLRLIGLLVTLALSLLVAPLAAEAQPAGKVYRIGCLAERTELPEPSLGEAMRSLGYEDHKLFFECRNAETREQLSALAAELVTRQVDLILTFGTPAAQAAKQATTTIPIVFNLAADPVQSGLVASFARPGGNLTGIARGVYEDKLLEILKEAIPGIRRVACPCPRDLPFGARIGDAARRLGLEILAIAVSGPKDIDHFFVAARRAGADAMLVPNVAWFSQHLPRFGALAAQSQLPAIGFRRDFAESGGLLSYARLQGDTFPRLAVLVDKILQGSKPADLPVEQPMRFELVINLKTAQALGITIPPTLLFQATEILREAER
jgi:putative tryptophan/tyrosine transport system substrate-binding protein